MSCLDNNNNNCYFGNMKCTIKMDEIDVDLAVRQDKLCLFPHCDHVNEMNTSSMNACDVSVNNKRKRNDD